ncbi:MAG: tripartite tricarboxylate transporter permease, partial [Anaerolineales bacterium]|nr:tripartite tricarboxylate transporter permease [Anaerolineales bacterium]
MSVEFIFRIIGMIICAILGGYWGALLGRLTEGKFELYLLTFGLIGALAGLILTPFFTTRPIRAIRSLLGRVAAETLLSALIGLFLGTIGFDIFTCQPRFTFGMQVLSDGIGLIPVIMGLFGVTEVL